MLKRIFARQMAVVILLALALYAAMGGLFAILFAWHGIDRLDPSAHGAPWTFRLLILPGVVALWPLLGLRWVRAMQTRGHS